MKAQFRAIRTIVRRTYCTANWQFALHFDGRFVLRGKGRRTNWQFVLLGLLLAGCLPVPATTPPDRIPATASPSPAATALPTRPGPPSRTLFVEPDDGAAPVLSAIGSARNSVEVVVYLLTDRSVIDALIAAHRRGAAVRVMLEQDPYGSGPGSASAYDRLRDAGVAVRWGNPAFALTHEKAIVVDGQTALIMTLNLVYSAFHFNRDYGIITQDPIEVAEVLAGFNADWERQGFRPQASSLLWSDANTRSKLLSLIDDARTSLLLEQEALQDRELLRHIAGAAERGVDVRVITPPESGDSDPNRRGRQQLVAAGAGVRTLEQPKMHAKITLADRSTAVIGSANITYSGMDNNRELGIRVVEPEIVERLTETFEADWAQAKEYGESD